MRRPLSNEGRWWDLLKDSSAAKIRVLAVVGMLPVFSFVILWRTLFDAHGSEEFLMTTLIILSLGGIRLKRW